MLNLNVEKLEQTAQAAIGRVSEVKDSKRWTNAINKAHALLRDSPYWHMVEDDTLLILSPASDQIYEVTEGACELIIGERRVACRAAAVGMPCYHRAARKLLVRYAQN